MTEELASVFIVSTCQLLPKFDSHASDRMQNLAMSTDAAEKQYTLYCGSFVELYIRPLNSCIDDVDALIAAADELVFTGDFPVLPSDVSGLSDTIKCGKIVQYRKYPSFVRLRFMGELTYDWKYKRYGFIETADSGIYLNRNIYNSHVVSTFSQQNRKWNKCMLPSVVCGPALKSHTDSNSCIGTDAVRSLFCTQWPGEAQNWPIRPRKYGWPLISAISEVVQSGCHVVYVQHRSCRDDKFQWRLSFSIAELILVQTWTQIQQIVYHLIRFFAKRELIEKDCPKENEVLCTYHLKTLMLWTCEEMPSEWWNSSSVISICCKLLIKLFEWLKRRHYPNYFIPEANLFYEPTNSRFLVKAEQVLNGFQNSDILCHWFVDNYILPVIRKQLQFLNSGKVTPHFMDYLLPLFEHRRAIESDSLNILFSYKFLDSYNCCRCVIKHGLSSGLRQNIKLRRNLTTHSRFPSAVFCLPTTEKFLRFAYFDNLLYILHTAYGLSYGEISWDGSLFVEFIEAVSMQHNIIRSQYHNFPKTYEEESSRFNYLRACNLMHNLTGSNGLAEFQLLSFMSKWFLRKALELDDSQFNGIASAAFAYLAALHFATSEKRQAIHFCLEAFDQNSGKKEETLNASCLLFIDDVARIVGFIVLHKTIRPTENNLQYIDRRLYLDLRISPEVFAYYLVALSDVTISKPLPNSTYPMDKYVKALIKTDYDVHYYNADRHIVYRRTVPGICAVDYMSGKESVIALLMEYALENMTLFYNGIRTEICVQSNTADCYRALFLYKSCHYDEVFHLCERILHEPDIHSDLKESALANVLLVPPLDSFFDRDVQSLLGFDTLFYYLSPLNGVMGKVELTDESTFSHCFSRSVCIRKVELSESLASPLTDVKCHYFLGRHFLARYLKVRCCIDCNLPSTKTITEFAAQKINLPFE